MNEINEEGLTGSWAAGDESPEHTIARLTHELQHMTKQCRVAHAMAMAWKARALVVEKQVRRLHPKADRGHGPHWNDWSWVWLNGEGRIAMLLITGQPPVRYTYPRQDWAGAIPWFDRAGVGLVFDEEDHDE